jgi:hypothetical protein
MTSVYSLENFAINQRMKENKRKNKKNLDLPLSIEALCNEVNKAGSFFMLIYIIARNQLLLGSLQY